MRQSRGRVLGGATSRGVAALAAVASLTLVGCSENSGVTAKARPDGEILAAISLSAGDAADANQFGLIAGGDEVAGETTLDLCAGDYPSEELRVARRQVEIAGDPLWVSSEAVIYQSSSAAAQAMSELTEVVQSCGSQGNDGGSSGNNTVAFPAAEDIANPTLTWKFSDPPDAGWPATAGVERQAYKFTVSDANGAASSFVTAYLRRGRVLLAAYTSPPDSQKKLVLHSPTMAKFVSVLANRLAALPAADVR